MFHKRSFLSAILRRERIPSEFPNTRCISVVRIDPRKALLRYGDRVTVVDLSSIAGASVRVAEGAPGFELVLKDKTAGCQAVAERLATRAMAEKAVKGLYLALMPRWLKWSRRALFLVAAYFAITFVLEAMASGARGMSAAAAGPEAAEMRLGAQRNSAPAQAMTPGRVSQGGFTPDLSGVDVPQAPGLSCEPSVK